MYMYLYKNSEKKIGGGGQRNIKWKICGGWGAKPQNFLSEYFYFSYLFLHKHIQSIHTRSKNVYALSKTLLKLRKHL